MAITINKELTFSESDRFFLDLVQNRITGYGQIPYTIPEKLMVDIIKESARYFFRHYYKATETKYFYLGMSEITGNGMPKMNGEISYEVKLPKYVRVVKEMYEGNYASQPTSQELIDNIQLLQRSAPYGQSILGINNSLYIMEACAKLVEEQNYSSIFGTSVPFHYNNFTCVLNIRKTPKYNFLLECMTDVDIQYLYNDDLYIRHVIGRVKQELSRVLAGHTTPLPGDVTLNVEAICNNLEDVEKVEEILKNSGGIGDLIMQR